MRRGDVVLATAGKDKGKPFIVLEVGDTLVLIADGRRRKVQRPKAKSEKHLSLLCQGTPDFVPTNKVILKLLRPYTNNFKEES